MGGENQTVGLGQDFCQKLHESERGGECGSLAPLGSANAKRFKTTNVFGLLQLRTFEVGTFSGISGCVTVPILLPQKRTESTNLAFSI